MELLLRHGVTFFKVGQELRISGVHNPLLFETVHNFRVTKMSIGDICVVQKRRSTIFGQVLLYRVKKCYFLTIISIIKTFLHGF